MPKLFDRVKIDTPTTGTGDVTFGSATSGAFLTPVDAGCSDADTVRYVIVDGTDYEEGVGTIGSSVTTMTRTVTKSKIGGTVGTTKMNLSGTAVMAFVTGSADTLNPANNLSDLASAPTALTNLGFTAVGVALGTAADAAAARTAIGEISIAQQTFTSSGTYTPTTGMVNAFIECWGGGGGAGGVTGATSNIIASGGGGAGSYSSKMASAADIGTSKAVTIGFAGAGQGGSTDGSNGGDTSVGSLCIAKGGGGGGYGAAGHQGAGGSGGVAGTGDTTGTGQPGGLGYNQSSTALNAPSGAGGSTSLGGGGASTATGNGKSATGYGAGGSGGSVFNSASTTGGGNGSPGYVRITEYVVS